MAELRHYDAFILQEINVKSKNLAGEVYSYSDFYDRYSSNCGGTRDGVKLEYVEGGLYSPPSEYLDW